VKALYSGTTGILQPGAAAGHDGGPLLGFILAATS
jgi:hypothetical protein